MRISDKKEYLNGLSVWALSFGGVIGWGCFIMPGSRFLPVAGPLGAIHGIILAAMFALIICINYSTMVEHFPETGGTYVYTKHILGEDHAFLVVWCLVLAYLSLIWANSTAFSLMFRYFAGDTLKWGFHYTIADYDVYLGEVFATIIIITVLGLITAYQCRLANIIRTIAAVLLMASVVLVFVLLLSANGFHIPLDPGFSLGESRPMQILNIFILAPWLYVGFETVTHAVGESKLSTGKIFFCAGLSVVCGMFVYIMLALMATISAPEPYTNWTEYIQNLDSLSGIDQIPVFYNTISALGPLGMWLLVIATMSALTTSVLVFCRSAARVISVMAQNGLLPEKLSKTNDAGVPVNACLLIIAASIPAPLLGRAIISWNADVSTLSCAVVYAYISICTFRTVSGHSVKKYLGLAGAILSFIILILLLAPNVFADRTLATEAYFMLALWSILGILYYRFIFNHDKKNRFGKSMIMWLMMLLLLFFSTNVLVRLSTEKRLAQVTAVPAETINSILRTSSLIQFTVISIALYITFSLFRAVSVRQREADMNALRAQEHNAAKSAFLSNMSHELRTPMNTIIGMTDILMREGIPDDSVEYVRNIKLSSERLLSLVNDILDFSKIESGHLELEEEEYDFIDLLKELSVVYVSNIGGKPVELLYEISPNIPCKMYGDTKRISQIVTNIVGNAVKYTDYGYVRVKVVPGKINGDDIDIKVSVYDSGRGIKPEDFDKIFQSFSQVDTKKNRGIEGAGLGLAISRQLIELMGGTIGVESEYGKGSCFYFDIHQKIVSAMPNTLPKDQIHSKKCAFCFDSPYETSSFTVMAESLDLPVAQVGTVEDFEATSYDYFVTDQYEFAKQVHKKFGDKCSVALLHNPMITSHPKEGFTVINKPLFCRNMNDFLNGESFQEDLGPVQKHFIAPNARILLVDDMPMNHKVTTEMLKPHKMQVDLALNGREALDKIYAGNYDLVFMDYMMPVMDGIEAVTELRKRTEKTYQELPVVALTANATVEAQKLFVNSGFTDFLSKPIHIDALLACILKYISPDKIKEGTMEEEINAAPEEVTELDINIPGVDPEKGVINSGSETIFIELLGDVYEIIDEKIDLIKSYLKADEIKNFTTQVHALKTTCRMIGAMDLAEDFYTLEKLGKENNLEQIEKFTPDVLDTFKALKPYLEPYSKKDDAPKADYDKDVVVSALNELTSAIDAFDLNASEEIMKKLSSMSYSGDLADKMQALNKLVSNLDYEEAKELSKQILDSI